MATANLLQTSVSGGTQNALSMQGDGVFFPKASTTSRLALTLTTTDKGFIVYDTTDNNIYFWNGAAWESIPGSGDAGANGSVQYNDNGIVSGATNFTYDKATSAVAIGGAATVQGLTVGKGAGTVATNSAFGVSALSLNTTAANGAAFGYEALKNNTAASNSAFGSNAGVTNTTGTENVFVGVNAGKLNLSGGNNTVVGASTGFTNSVGVNNTIIGAGAAYSATNSTNTVIGSSAAANLTSGASNTVIGASAGNSSGVINLTTQSNRVVIGDANVTNAYILVAWTVTSDSRDKSDVKTAPYGLQFVNELIPITYKWDKREKYENSTPDGTHKESKTQLGFLAQDVIALEKKHGGVAGDLLIADDETEESLKITETKFIPILVKAIQELTARVRTLESR
jgi:hypothetical protein